MTIGKYGLRDPHSLPINGFNLNEEYVVNFYTKKDNFSYNCWVKVVKANNNEVVLHVQQETADSSAIQIKQTESKSPHSRTEVSSRAIINGHKRNIECLGFVNMFNDDDILLFYGEEQDGTDTKVFVQSRDTARSITTNIRTPMLFTETIFEDVELICDYNTGIEVEKGEENIEITELEPVKDCWLALATEIEHMNSYTLDVSGFSGVYF